MSDSCRVCTTLDTAALERISSAYLAGTSSLESLAAEFRQPFVDMHRHCANCIRVKANRFTRIETLVDQLESDVKVAQNEFLDSPGDKDAASAYTGLLKEYRAAIETANSMVRPEDQAREFIEGVVEPLVRELVQASTNELGRLRDELLAAGLPDATVNPTVTSHLKALSQHLKISLTEATKRTHKLLGSSLPKDSS